MPSTASITRQTWLLLAERLATLQRLREEKELLEVEVHLVFDAHDQAKLA